MVRRSLLALASVLALPCAHACDTPVWQYAMLNWEPEPYIVAYFHAGAEDPADAEVNTRLSQAATGPESPANISFVSIDVADPSRVLPGYLRAALDAAGDRPLPYHVVIAPNGKPVRTGRLAPRDLDALRDSPARRSLVKLLSDRAQGVLIVLSGTDADRTRGAEETVRAAIDDARAQGATTAWMSVDRKSPDEAWLVRALLAIEPDLADLTEPMVFGVFGRGYSLPPYVGPGITAENMTELTLFMNGPCTCEIKESNEGMDLLTAFDWRAHLEAFVPDATAQGGPGFQEIPVETLLQGR